jgi:hypothetical protein
LKTAVGLFYLLPHLKPRGQFACEGEFPFQEGRINRPVSQNSNAYLYQISGISPARSCGEEWQNALKTGGRSFNMRRF